MAWRRRRKGGRPRKVKAVRYPSGGVKHESVTPPNEVLAKRAAMFGRDRVQGETDWVIDRLWGAGALDERARGAAQRLNALYRGRLSRCGAPRLALMQFHDARGFSPDPHADAEALDVQLDAALAALAALGAPTARAVLDAVAFNRAGDVALLRVGLAALAAHFARPLSRRLAP